MKSLPKRLCRIKTFELFEGDDVVSVCVGLEVRAFHKLLGISRNQHQRQEMRGMKS